MQNDANNETEVSTTGETPVVESNKQEQPAEAQAPVTAPESSTGQTTASTASAPATPSTTESPAAVAERAEPRRVAKPAAPAQEIPEEKSGEIDFAKILEQFEQEQTVYHAGDLVEGRVVGVSERGALVDFGYKSEGIIPAEESSAGDEPLNVGDTVEVVIKSIHAGDAPPQLSRTDAKSRKIWNDLEDAYKNDAAVVGKIVDKTKGGLKVDINGIEGFLPGSQIDSRPIRSLDSYIGQDIEAKIIKFSRRRNNIVLSRKVITDVAINEQKAATLDKIDIGFVVEGTIKNLTEYGAFVDIGGIDGLLHVTDMSWGRLQNPADSFRVGEHIQVKVLKLDREKEKVSLGYKQLQPDPWSTVAEVYPVDSRVNGKVSSVTEYGIFVELEPGVEGLVHVSEISWSKRGANPKRQFHKGDEVEVQVLGVDTHEKRISLGMKQLQENPWDTVAVRYPVGTKIHGKVRNLTDFGAFVELEEGIDGLVHVSDITWAKKLKHPKELLKKDQEVDAIVTNIDPRGQRLSLSMKDLTPSAWEGFVATHRPGDVVRGKVTRFTSFGAFVELGEGLEGLCHISELSDERVEKPEDVVQLGQELDFKILRIENDEQKIGLSARAVGKADEPVVDTRQFSSEAKGGMASLGELANLLKTDDEPVAQELSKEEKEAAKREKKERARREYEETTAREAAAAEQPVVEEEATEAPATEEAAEAPATESAAPEAQEPVAEAPEPDSTATAEAETPETPPAEGVTAKAETPEPPAAEGVTAETETEAAANDPEAASAEVQSEADSEAQTTATTEGPAPPVDETTEEAKEESEQQSA
ncbi:MAG TPA: 30S ribosomal protein S1 [Pyrinomonadaceae bacterium]|nr:30S ribosomal protein S1 [Pyrinomonadaceae bacterium]